MNCLNCDYPLWNLSTRQCPECGAPFRPGEREFAPNAIRFCCPKCDQAYYGTDQHGHLVPRSFTCVRCDQPVEMDDMVLRPAEGVREEDTQHRPFPWGERRRRGWFRSWRRTVGASMIGPVRLMRGIPAETAAGSTWGYAALTLLIIVGLGIGPIGALIGLAQGSLFSVVMGTVTAVGGGVVGFLGFIGLWGLVAHLVLSITGGTQHSMGRTFQALCFSSGANVSSAVPFVGVYPFIFVGLLWWLISAILMLGEGQRVSGVRAAVATLALPLVVTGLLVAGLMGMMFWGLQQAQVAIAAQQGPGLAQTETAIVAEGLIVYRATNGAWPPHAAAMSGVEIEPLDFVGTDTATYPEEFSVGDTTLEGLEALTGDERTAVIDAAVAALPAEPVAHRAGDFVFTYHGVDPDTAPGSTWLVIMSPDPAVNARREVAGVLVAGRADGETETIALGEFDAKLAAQNAAQSAMGLAPIPPPWEVE